MNNVLNPVQLELFMDLKTLNTQIIKKARTLVYIITLILAGVIWFTYSQNGKPTLDVSNAFGFLSFSFLCLSLIVTPIRVIWPTYPLNGTFLMARRAFGVSAFIFGFAHYILQLIINFNSDFNVLLSYMLSGMAYPLVASYIVFLIFALLAITSFDFAVKKLGKYWFTIHKLAYLAYPLIIYHAVSIGVDFFDKPLNVFSGSFFIIAIVTIILESIRVWKGFSKKSGAQA